MYLSAAGSLAAETRMDVIANNLANVDTPGFKRSFAVFQERLNEAKEPPRLEMSRRAVLDRVGGGLFVHEVAFDPSNGPMQQTSNSLDVAIEGDGWFTVGVGSERFFTRAGNFSKSAAGFLVTADGEARVLDDKGRPIRIPDGDLTIAEDGQISVDGTAVARLWVQGSADPKRYLPVGGNRYQLTEGPTPGPASARLHQGFVERSTVSPVQEMVTLIRTSRAYEANQRMITQQDQALGRVVNDVGRVG